MTDKMEIGRAGENLAANFMAAKGWEIVVRNYRYGKAEIDLILKKDDWLLFVEVKTRSSSDYGEPEAFVDDKKIFQIQYAAEHYIFSTDWRGKVRFDVISVKFGKPPVVEHFEDAIS
jgi:putative endonuclease